MNVSDFSIHDVKMTKELYDVDDVNEYLQSGWVLLAVGFNTEDSETYKVYILGTTTPPSSETNNPLADALKK